MNNDEYCSVIDVAQALKVGWGEVYEMMKSGELETTQFGDRRLIKIDSVNALIESATDSAE